MKNNKCVETIIKSILEERGIQQKFICQKIGILPQTFSYCLNGKRKLKTWEFIAICNLLKLDFSFLVCKRP